MELKPEHCIAEGSGPTPCCNAISVYTRSRPLVVENGVYLFSHPARLGTTGGTQSEKHLNYGMYPKGIVNDILQWLRNCCRFSLHIQYIITTKLLWDLRLHVKRFSGWAVEGPETRLRRYSVLQCFDLRKPMATTIYGSSSHKFSVAFFFLL